MDGALEHLLRRLRRRLEGGGLACGLLAAAPVGAAFLHRGHALPAMILLALPVALWVAWRLAGRRLSAERLTRALDRSLPQLEDSAGLLLRSPPELATSALARVQRERVAARLASLAPSLRPPTLGLGLHPALRAAPLLGLAAACVVALVPGRSASGPALEIQVVPPAYTGLPPFTAGEGDFQVPEDSAVTWRLTGGSPIEAAAWRRAGEAPAAFDDERVFRRQVSEDLLYEISWRSPSGGGTTPPAMVTVLPDRPPRLRLLAPAEWPVEFSEPPSRGLEFAVEAEDDHGIGDAALLLTVASGQGESVKFREKRVHLPLEGGPRRGAGRQFLDPAALGLAPGDELYVQAEIVDNRLPQPRRSRSPTVVYRWRGDESGATLLAGMPVDRMPDYFRSQRQIIIDTEALLADREELAPAAVRARSEALAQDQRALRLRYGQYLGEEVESGASPLAGPDSPQAGAPREPAGPDHDAPADGEGGSADHHGEHAGHAHAQADEHPEAGGGTPDLLTLFGHSHDFAEQATLFDAGTRATLKSALAAMWQAELQLGLIAPEAALPHEYQALERLKAVQQAARIYVRRVGFEPPPLSEERRLSGDRDGLRSRSVTHAGGPEASPEATLLAALLAAGGDEERVREALTPPASTAGLDREIRLVAERARLDPGCARCRRELLRALWSDVPPPFRPPLRAIVNGSPAAGEAYRRSLARPGDAGP